MRKLLRVLAYLVIGVLSLVVLALLYVLIAYPKSEPPADLEVAMTPTTIERGRYLFHNLAQCVECHAMRDTDAPGSPIVEGGLGKENMSWVEEGAPFFPPNITPAALGNWTDGEIARAISSGIRKDGKALFPAMPYDAYRVMSREDLEALIAYLRSLEPIPVEHPRKPLGLPFSVIARFSARPAETPERTPSVSDGPAYGRYLVAISGCEFCHTPGEPPNLQRELAFGGGHEFWTDEWIIRSANITPDSATGIGTWTKERLITRFKGAASRPNTVPPPGGGEGPESPMPWARYAAMHDEDLGAIYDHLMALEPMRRPIVRIEPRPPGED
jgi:mono/diheme cytochrome c family protein